MPNERRTMPGKRLYRACKAPLGGVCAGVADYFGMDAIVARIVAVAGTIVSGGLLGVAYVAMVAVVPREPDCASCYDVRPQAVVSDKSGPIPFSPKPCGCRRETSAYMRQSYRSVGHIPPEPPVGLGDDGFENDIDFGFYQVK